MIKKLSLIGLLWVFSGHAFASDSCADEGEGNNDWISIGTSQGPDDSSGCGGGDSVIQHIIVEVRSQPQLCNEVSNCDYGPYYAYMNVIEPNPYSVFSLNFDGLLNNTGVGNTIKFADFHAQLPNGDFRKLMDLSIKKVPGTRYGNDWLININWYSLGFMSDMAPTSITVPGDFSDHIQFFVNWSTRSSKIGQYVDFNVDVIGAGINTRFSHPNHFDVATQPSSLGLGLISADQVPPLGDVIHIINGVNIYVVE